MWGSVLGGDLDTNDREFMGPRQLQHLQTLLNTCLFKPMNHGFQHLSQFQLLFQLQYPMSICWQFWVPLFLGLQPSYCLPSASSYSGIDITCVLSRRFVVDIVCGFWFCYLSSVYFHVRGNSGKF